MVGQRFSPMYASIPVTSLFTINNNLNQAEFILALWNAKRNAVPGRDRVSSTGKDRGHARRNTMRNLNPVKYLIISSIFGTVALVGAALPANAQNRNEEYREWQEARRNVREERADYMRTRSRSDYRDWQEAQRDARQEYREYTRANNRYNNRNENRRYRIFRNGQYFYTDSRGAELLRSAVNTGYRQGYREGRMDRQRSRGFNYNNSSIYRNGSYGYQSYVARNQYQYYFQQGFQRGYQDGFYNTTRYGRRSGNDFNILGNVVSGILNIIDDIDD